MTKETDILKTRIKNKRIGAIKIDFFLAGLIWGIIIGVFLMILIANLPF